jgi:endonuclease/exonuclease/phosphatase (EEP) superfamily protein YafD
MPFIRGGLFRSESSTSTKSIPNVVITDKGYTQLINQYTTDYRTQIDHVYTNVPQCVQSAGTLESYYSDHKPIYISMKAV